MKKQGMGPNSVSTRIFVGMMAASGFTLLAYNILQKQPLHPLQFGALLRCTIAGLIRSHPLLDPDGSGRDHYRAD